MRPRVWNRDFRRVSRQTRRSSHQRCSASGLKPKVQDRNRVDKLSAPCL